MIDKVFPFKPRQSPQPPLSPEERQFDSIVFALQDMTPEQRISAIAASCDGDDWKELAALAIYFVLGGMTPQERIKAIKEMLSDAAKQR